MGTRHPPLRRRGPSTTVALALLFALLVPIAACSRPAPRPRPKPPAVPPASPSLYVRTTDPGTLDDLGCRQGRAAASSGQPERIAVLAFGKPRVVGDGYGVSAFGPGFVSVEDVERAALAYADGYARCGPTGGRVVLALGTSNFGHQVTYEHGRAWALMVNGVNERLAEAGLNERIEAAGASDLELGWNGPAVTREWVDGYGSVARWPYYDFGEALACPPAGTCHGRWTQEDVWYVAWGAPFARPLPEIYADSGVMADQWYRLSLYAFLHHGVRMTIAGAVSQAQACEQTGTSCAGLSNGPAEAWTQLWTALNGDPRTAQPLAWSTDFGWSGR